MIGSVEVIVLNQPPRALRKLGLNSDCTGQIREDNFFVSITSFGPKGKRADWPCYDPIAEGYSGITALSTAPPVTRGTGHHSGFGAPHAEEA